MPILKTLKQHKILLDTHVLLWVMIDDSHLSKEFCQAFERCQKLHNVWISSMTIWEIGMLVEKKRIEIEMDVLDWINHVLECSEIQVCSITPRIAILSTRLPEVPHGDPVDRLLIATAHEENYVLVSYDKKILSYGQGKWIHVLNPCV